MKQFFEAVLPNSDGYVPIITMDGNGKLRRTQWFRWPSEAADMYEYIEEREEEDVYFSPMLFNEPGTRTTAGHVSKVNVIAATSVYADADTAAPSVFKAQPTISVQTSPGKWHTYWVLDDCDEPKMIEALSRSITRHHKADGVDNGWALSKRLRVPGTTNTKYELPYRVLVDYDGPVYSLGEFAADYEPVEEDEDAEQEFPADIPDAWDVLNTIEADPELFSLFQNPPLNDYSLALYTLELKLYRLGLTPTQVFAVAREAACNKFNRPGRSDNDLWRHVLHTLKSYREEEGTQQLAAGGFVELEDAEEHSLTVGKAETWDDLDLLEPEERATLKTTFIEEYADWCMAQSALSARQYHEGSALMILATVLGEFGYVRPSFGKVSLNLYMLVLGQTTRSRKSTAKSFMIRIIEALSPEESEWRYEIGQDVTPEALTEYLSEREGKSSLYWRDEVQGLFEAVKSGGYLRGLFAMLTNAYDGAVDGVLRKTGANKRTSRTETNLNFYGMGIMEQVANIVTDEEFESGYLPRFMWVIDNDARYNVGSADVSQFEETSHGDLDTKFRRMVMDLSDTRNIWDRHRNSTGEKARIVFTPEAWSRWQQFTIDLETHAENHATRAKVLDAPAQRMGVTVLKLAALIAMSERRQTVEMSDLLVAINYGTKFMRYAEYAARQVSKTHFARDLEELETLVVTAPKAVTYASVLRHFKGRKTLREVNEMIEYLTESGSLALRLSENKKTKVLEAI